VIGNSNLHQAPFPEGRIDAGKRAIGVAGAGMSFFDKDGEDRENDENGE